MIPGWLRRMFRRADCDASVRALRQARGEAVGASWYVVKAALNDISLNDPETAPAKADDKIYAAIVDMARKYKEVRRRDT